MNCVFFFVSVLYREKVILQCVACLQCNTRQVQVSIVAAVIKYLEKLTLLQKQSLSDSENEELKRILSNVMQALSYALSKLFLICLCIVYFIEQRLMEGI